MIRLAFIDLGSRLVQYFVAVSRVLDPEIEAYFFCIKHKSWSIAKQSGFPTFPQTRSRCYSRQVPDNIKGQIINDKILADYTDDKKLARLIDWLYPILEDFIKQQRIDAVFVWNGSGLTASVAVNLAHKYKLQTLFGENGYFYNTIQLDPAGVNQAASITRVIANDYQSIDLEEEKLKQLQLLRDAYKNDTSPHYARPQNRITPSLLARLADEWKSLIGKQTLKFRNLNRAVPSTISKLPEKYIFMPFQVVKDSQLLLYSPLVGNDMRLYLSTCHAAVNAVAKDYKLIVKLHPADINNMDYTDLMGRFPDVIFLKDYPSNKLIQSASLIITINSTIGVEALLYDKPVITLGENFYNVPDVVYHIESLSDLPHIIALALTNPPDRKKIQRLLYYLHNCYFTQGSWKNYAAESLHNVAAGISRLLTQSKAQANH